MFKYLFINSKFNKYVDNLEIDSIFVDEINDYIMDMTLPKSPNYILSKEIMFVLNNSSVPKGAFR